MPRPQKHWGRGVTPSPPGIADSRTPRGPGAALLRERMWGQKAWQWDATVASIPCTVGPGTPAAPNRSLRTEGIAV